MSLGHLMVSLVSKLSFSYLALSSAFAKSLDLQCFFYIRSYLSLQARMSC